MIIHCSDGVELAEETCQIEAAQHRVLWEGFVFVRGIVAGEPSIQQFVKVLENEGLHKACRILSGSYAVAVKEYTTGRWNVFCDDGRSIPVYYTDQLVSTSFLQAVSASYLKPEDLIPIKIVEYVLTGMQFGSKILFKGVHIINADEIIEIDQGRLSISKKRLFRDPFLMPAPKNCTQTFLELWASLAESIREEHLSVDLTGGTDTRLIVGLLDSLDVPFETAVSGIAGHSDVVISSKIAKLLEGRHSHHPTIHQVDPAHLWRDIDDVLLAVDGLSDAVQAHRLYLLAKERKERGISLVIGGSGGELYKDGGWWRAALRANLLPGDRRKRLISSLVASGLIGWGMEAHVPLELFHPSLRSAASSYKPQLYKKLCQLYLQKSSSNTYELGDRLFYEYSVRTPRGFGARMLPTYHPLLDPEFVAVGIHIPWKKRFLHQFYRDILCSVSLELANLPTNRGGMNLQRRSVAGDLFRGLLSVAHPNRDKNIPKEDPLLWEVVQTKVNEEGVIQDLKEWKILDSIIEVKHIPNRYLGRLVTLWKLCRIIPSNT